MHSYFAVRPGDTEKRPRGEKTNFFENETKPKGYFCCYSSSSCELWTNQMFSILFASFLVAMHCIRMYVHCPVVHHHLTMKNENPKTEIAIENCQLPIIPSPFGRSLLHITISDAIHLNEISRMFQWVWRICCSICHIVICPTIHTRPIGVYELWKIIFSPFSLVTEWCSAKTDLQCIALSSLSSA